MSSQKILDIFMFRQSKNWIKEFFEFDIIAFEELLRNESISFWQELSQRRALEIFHEAAVRVPAYSLFLKENKILPTDIKTIEDFECLPTTDKRNYIQKYSIEELCWDGKIENTTLIAMSSGTSGTATFWPRGNYQEFEAAVTHELIYRYLFGIDKFKTLLVIGFPMGVYVSGIATLLPTWLIAQKYDITLVSVGTNKKDILSVIKNFKNPCEQIILIGHPFFIKDVIETGLSEGVSWGKKRLRMMFRSEGFSDSWREFVLRKASVTMEDIGIINTYGSSELLLIAYETNASLAIHKIYRNQQDSTLTEQNHFQYNPFFRYIETIKEEFVFTSFSGVPLIRYNLHDKGKILGTEETLNVLKSSESFWKLPFLSMGGRSDYTLVFYAANIYPEQVRQALDCKQFLDKLTGRFVMRKDYTETMDEFLEINIELNMQTKICDSDNLDIQIQERLIQCLKDVNREYLFLWNNLNKDIRPKIKLWDYESGNFFRPGVKHRYIV